MVDSTVSSSAASVADSDRRGSDTASSVCSEDGYTAYKPAKHDDKLSQTAEQKVLNVYRGETSLKDYYNPSCHPHLPLVELPDSLNPYRADGVRIYAKMMTFLPAHNVKALPALNMLQNTAPQTKTIVEYSSGSTVISMAVLAKVLHGIDDVHAYLSNKTAGAKLKLMQFFGLKITLFGGPSQPEPTDPRGGIQRAIAWSKNRHDVVNPNQYENTQNYEAHIRWTGPQLLEQLPELDVFAAGLGTSGTMTGIGTYLKRSKPSVTRVGVCTAVGDRVPGPRSVALLDPVQFPWREAIDHMEEVGSRDSFRLSLDLSRNGIVCGPSSGFNLQGLYQYLSKRKQDGTLRDLSTRQDGEIHCAFICCDLPYQYIDEYFHHLDEQCFPSITNEVDKYRYDDRWELPSPDFLDKFAQASARPVVLDLRDEQAFASFHLPDSFSLSLSTLPSASQPSPFSDPSILERQWRELDGALKMAPLLSKDQKQPFLCVDYGGDTARIACSILRGRGLEAWSLRAGIDSLSSSVRASLNKAAEQRSQKPVFEQAGSGVGLPEALPVAV